MGSTRDARRAVLDRRPGHIVDLMPTFVELAGAQYPAAMPPMEGQSLLPAFRGRRFDRGPMFWEHEGNRAIRAGKWKAVAVAPGGPWEPYDMDADRTEMRNLAAQHPGRLKEMVAQWEQWARRTNTSGGSGAHVSARGGGMSLSSRPDVMVMDMATTKITVTLPKERLDQVKALVGSGSASKISAFVKHAIDVAIQDANGFRAMLDEALEQTGGPLTDKERAWVDSLLSPRRQRKSGRRKVA